MRPWLIGLMAALCLPATTRAGEADVVGVEVVEMESGAYRFQTMVRHADEGWQHYADKWEVATPDGRVLGRRILHHPHTHEQPFTRTLSGVEVPAGVDRVRVRAHDSVHGYGGAVQSVELP